MFPANNINGIKEQEELLEGSHAIILLFVKPSDDNADKRRDDCHCNGGDDATVC